MTANRVFLEPEQARPDGAFNNGNNIEGTERSVISEQTKYTLAQRFQLPQILFRLKTIEIVVYTERGNDQKISRKIEHFGLILSKDLFDEDKKIFLFS